MTSTPPAFNLAKAVALNESDISSRSSGLVISTPHQQWAYAVEVPLVESTEIPLGELTVTVNVECTKGAVGVALLRRDGSSFLIEAAVADRQPSLKLHVADLHDIRSLIIRNVSSRGSSTAVLREIIVGPKLEDDVCTLDVDDGDFRQFGVWRGEVPPGYLADWSGVLTRSDVWTFSEQDLAISSKRRIESHEIPTAAAPVMDWIALAESVAASREVFRMTALGAGWGRWASAGAFLARRINLDYRILAVEAEPQHFAWLQRHIAENDLADERTAILHAAAAGRPGYCWFQTGNAVAHYGQSIQSFNEEPPTAGRVEKVEAVTLEQILARLSPLDYLHMDIQGAELDLLSAFPAVLDAQVKYVNIGTHSVEIDVGLRRLFNGLGWSSRYDIPIGSKRRIRVGGRESVVDFEDGVQVWVNHKWRSTP